jgi:hypothetical protein
MFYSLLFLEEGAADPTLPHSIPYFVPQVGRYQKYNNHTLH